MSPAPPPAGAIQVAVCAASSETDLRLTSAVQVHAALQSHTHFRLEMEIPEGDGSIRIKRLCGALLCPRPNSSGAARLGRCDPERRGRASVRREEDVPRRARA